MIQPTPSPTGQGEFFGVSCPSVTDCPAFGDDGQDALVEHWDGMTWTVQHVPMPADARLADLDGGVSCSSATRCTAVGDLSNTRPHRVDSHLVTCRDLGLSRQGSGQAEHQ